MYIYGDGVPQDDSEALYWLLIAEQRGSDTIRGRIAEEIAEVRSRLSEKRIQAVEQRAAEWTSL